MGRQPRQLTWAEFAEDQCRYYIAMGLSADEYWNGDYRNLKYYRQGYFVKKDIDNYDAWLQGLYIYEAIVDSAPILRAFSKARRPLPYPSKPYEISRELNRREKEEKERARMETIRSKTEAFASAWNKKRRAQKETDGGG